MRIRHLAAAAVLAAAVLALATCSNPVDLVEAATVEVMKANDRYLEVVSTTPVNGDDEVNPGTRVKIWFDRPIDMATVDSSTVRFVQHIGGAEVPWTATFDDQQYILSIKPDSILNNFARYDLTVDGVRGTDGRGSLESRAWYFETTEAPTGQVTVANELDILTGYTKYSTVDISIENPNWLANAFTVASSEAALDDPVLNGGSWAWTSIPNSREDYALTTSQGTKYVFVVLKNSAATPSYSSVIDGSIVYDTVIPSAGTWRINSNATYTNAASTSFAVTTAPSDATSGVYQMRFSNNNSTWSSWETYASSKTWDINNATYGGNTNQGSKTAYVQVRDKAGNVSSATSDSITYDTVAPSAGTWRINSDEAYSNSAVVTLAPTIAPSDGTSGIAQMRFSNNNSSWSAWETYASTKSWDMTSTIYGGNTNQGTKTVYIQVKDGAGNGTGSVSDSITYDTMGPDAPSITSVSVPTYNNRTVATSVTWNWTSGASAGNGTFRSAFNATPSGSGSPTTSATQTTDGLWTLYVQERDAAGNWSPSAARTVRITPTIPYNGETNIPTTISSANRLAWRPLFGALEYRVRTKYQITTKLWSSWSSYIYTSETAITSGIPALPAATLFRWQVYARTKLGWPAENETTYYTFTTH